MCLKRLCFNLAATSRVAFAIYALQLRERVLVPTLHAAVPNSKIALDGSPFLLQQRIAPWELPSGVGPSVKRRAGLSSFGAGGANAHVIVEEYIGAVRTELPFSEGRFILSAKRPNMQAGSLPVPSRRGIDANRAGSGPWRHQGVAQP